ncbi:uncharacterized protein LOC123704454 [Colias croceus]|uniref:uncharacterized protein LOC123704454 n=1 Tax=Colias crocea TaxID=72248 RepID=UPI001E27EF43|nr:uncharacterized protein LOC123704454 [Colias croceus]
MPYYCTVPRCTSMAGKAKNVSFHQFPRDEGLAKLWNEVLKRGKPYTKYSKVCSLHFKPDDYTITSGQKNKGQWRTLRKDAVPSQNLPSESPSEEWQRRNSATWPATLNVDTSMHHQMAQAIYVQTMLAMQAAGITDTGMNAVNIDQPSPSQNDTSHDETDSNPSIQTENEQTDRKIMPNKVTYRCHECSKCFKDPDVLLLHQRTHAKSEIAPGNTEMLKANPILANLLKNDTENVNKNVISIENQIMSALTENMANYLRNLTTIMTAGNTEYAIDKVENADDCQFRNDSNGEANDVTETIDYKENITSSDFSVDKSAGNKSADSFSDINNDVAYGTENTSFATDNIFKGERIENGANCDSEKT